YIFTMMTGIFFGISQGLQPLISRSYGEENHENVRYYFRAGVGISFGCAGVLYGLLLVFGRGVIRAFVEDPAVIESAYTCLKIYGMAFLPAAVNIVFNTYFLSTKRTARALGVALTRGVVLNSACVFLLPMLFGPGAIWYSMVVAELATVGVAIALWRARAGDAAPNKISGKRPLRGV
ncbi:hypothetical protein LJC32_06790, partial [Oscillospiraceae bacterium OttesenSCG-928-F05]|nr:hypothetical protein [Oscillospiraceae bacterium OttesenSCG-928-F05]